MPNERRELLLKLGFFPVTEDFWYGAEMAWAALGEFEWAFRAPFGKQTKKGLRKKATRNLRKSRVFFF